MKLTEDEVERLRQHLLSRDDLLEEMEHAHFKVRRPGLTVVSYLSGTLTVQGKAASDFLEFELYPEVLQRHGPEQPALEAAHIGSDESGKGDFFGPLVICAAAAQTGDITKLQKMGVQDSKRLTDEQAQRLAGQIREQICTKMVVIRPERYNRLYYRSGNLNTLLAQAHVHAIAALEKEVNVKYALVDQFAYPRVLENEARKAGLTLEIRQRTKAESDMVVAAASIVARATFLQELRECSKVAGLHLPKGASSQVLAAAHELAQQRGPEALAQVCKLHFKSLNEVVGSARAQVLREAYGAGPIRRA